MMAALCQVMESAEDTTFWSVVLLLFVTNPVINYSFFSLLALNACTHAFSQFSPVGVTSHKLSYVPA